MAVASESVASEVLQLFDDRSKNGWFLQNRCFQNFRKIHRPATLLKRRLRYRYFSVNFAKFLRTHFFTEHLRWLLLVLSQNTFNSLRKEPPP